MFILEELPETKEEAILYLRGYKVCGVDEWELCLFLIGCCSEGSDDSLRF